MEYIELKGMLFHSFVGHFDEEKIIGNKISIDLRIGIKKTKAGKTDNIDDAVDYVRVYELVEKEMKKECNLIENVAERITSKILKKFKKVEKVEVKVSKLAPQFGGIVSEVSIIKTQRRKKNKK